MPIYAYRCASCGHAKDVLRKISDAPLSQCPQCGQDTFRKQLTAAGFQLKGSGWYATDFRDNTAKNVDAVDESATKPAADTDAAAAAKPVADTSAAPAVKPAAAAAAASQPPAAPSVPTGGN